MLAFLLCLIPFLIILPIQHLAQLANQHDNRVLQTAKIAVVAWAVARYPGREEKRDIRLGEMVMPDKDPPGARTGVGIQDSTASIGRLPWKTLGIPPLFDAHGEPLWYSVSSRFRDNGQLEVRLSCQGLRHFSIYAAPYSQPIITQDIAAIVIAPHRALLRQERDSLAHKKQVYQYIESAHKEALYLRTSKDMYRHLMQGNKRVGGRIVMNDKLLLIECHSVMQKLAKRRIRDDCF